MNIKQHIEAGHYPVDSKGRALVPMANGDIATILATDLGDDEPIAGWDGDSVERWSANGSYGEQAAPSILCLLPPAPRRVEVKALAIVIAGTGTVLNLRDRNDPPSLDRRIERLVELTGSYEESWS